MKGNTWRLQSSDGGKYKALKLLKTCVPAVKSVRRRTAVEKAGESLGPYSARPGLPS